MARPALRDQPVSGILRTRPRAAQSSPDRNWIPLDIRAGALPSVACLVLLLGLVSAGCTRESSRPDEAPDITARLALTPDPPVVGEARAELTLEDDRGIGIDGASLELRADMTHAGMSPWIGDLETLGAGHYEARFEWTMAGDWVLTVEGSLEDGRRLRRTFRVTVSTP